MTDEQDGLKKWYDARPPRLRTTSEHVIVTLREAILSGRLKQGTPLRQEELALSLSVSRMPIREALRALEVEGLVTFKPHHGFTVARFGTEDILDIAQIRLGLEVAALRRAIPLHTTESLAEAAGHLEALNSARDVNAAIEAHTRFHVALYAPAGLPRLLGLVQQHLTLAEGFLRIEATQFALLTDSDRAEHLALLSACRSRRVDDALNLLEEHLVQAAEELAENLQLVSS